jgi:hypothetical protein
VTEIDRDALKPFARKYIWWKTPEEAVAFPERVIAQVMELGDYDDVQTLARDVGDAVLRRVIARAEPGWFSEKSWAYWHYRLALARPGQVPARPRRRFE